jgi:putative DNA primase/helicase
MSEGRRNTDLTSLAGYFRRRGFDARGIFEQLQAVNLNSSDPLDAGEVASIANSVSRNYQSDAKGELHDLPVSRIVAEDIAHFCKYIPETGWRVFDGRYWRHDPSGIYARERIKCQLAALVEAVKAGGDIEAVRDARKYLSNTRINAVTSLIMSDPNIVSDHADFDSCPSVLNLRNGTLDLETGQLMHHEATDLLSKIADVTYDPQADCPHFKQVLSWALPPEHAAFLLRYLGYALLGAPREQVFAILYGAGANGKSTLINAVSHLLGDYSANVEPATLIKQKSDKVRSDVARLQGVHLAVTSELAAGEILDAPLVKRFTGDDKITARALYSAEVEYKAKFVLVMTTNALPVIDGGDPALARRLVLLPFTKVVSEADRDPDLARKLEAEAPGILNLLLEGLQEYREIGLALPGDLKAEVAKFVVSSDMVAAFLQDETEAVADGAVGAKALYNHYRTSCGMSGIRALSMPQFRQEMLKKGYVTKRSRDGQAWQGLRLRRPHL